jgi:hypothetical protein
MKARVLGTGITIEVGHFFIVIASILLLSIVGALLIYRDLFPQFALALTLIGPLLLAFLFLRMAPIFRYKRDEAFARSCAGANFIVIAILSILAIGSILVVDPGAPTYYLFGGLMGIFGSLLGNVAGGILIYLWMLLLISPQRERLEKAAGYAIAFAALMFIITGAYTFFTLYALDEVYVLDIGSVMTLAVLSNLFFGFIVLYSYPDRIGKWATLFAGSYIGSSLFLDLRELFMNFVTVQLNDPSLVANLAHALFSLALIYILGRHMLSSNPSV